MLELDGLQSRQQIDTEQLYAAWRVASRELAERFAGAMSWKRVGGRRYLYRKTDGRWHSLGPESDATRLTYDRFHAGRTEWRTRREGLEREIARIGPVNRAMRMGRVPLTAARVLRRLDRLGVLGHGLRVVGTHALYAYEVMAGVHFGADQVATQDVDLLYDARGGLDLVGSGLADVGLIGLLRAIDGSFAPLGEGSFRAVNDRGYMVDLITPATRSPATRSFRARLGDAEDDLTAAEIEGLAWLESSPAVEVTALDERGFPLLIVAPDPRAFVCHKLWVAERADREPIKRRRDRRQAETVARMLTVYLPALDFDDEALSALPLAVVAKGRALALALRDTAGGAQDWM